MSRFRVGSFLAFLFRSLLWSLNWLAVLYTLLLYGLLHYLPLQHWSASMLLITMPVAWAINLVFVGLWLAARPWRSTLSALVLLVGFPFWARTFAWNRITDKPTGQITVRVMNYNVMQFGVNGFLEHTRPLAESEAITQWVVQHPAPVKCFQEFYNNASAQPAFQTINRLRAAGYRDSTTLHPRGLHIENGAPGVAIFSRYPILNRGEVVFNETNGLLWADLLIEQDTLRIINVHLESMGIRVRRVFNQAELAGVRHETHGVLGALKEGFIKRREQVEVVEDQIRQSPYPVLLVGDFNDTPYSVVYERLRRLLRNSFEDAGRGFGFSLNRAPRYIRIDNQFYDPHHLQPLDFQTHRDFPFSDHYPVEGLYALKQ